MSETVHVPGGRRVVATLDSPETDRAVVACPPHPRYGGSRSDQRLRAVSDALGPDVACLRFDYGPWDGGRGERVDAENALAWASERYDAVGLFGYSFGADVALRAAAEVSEDDAPAALSVLAPPAALSNGDAVTALDAIDCPVQVVYGDRDDTVDWKPVVERAQELDHAVESVAADHHFVGQAEDVADVVATFLRAHL
ncbi:dienelactone hydrolase family protein [Halomicroarcula sp. S1AR25-4]|uniref:alpha/beta hydrolase n=1 Tax=Haloarcula sp. S1AR25-4 TaxID=2950538 RepID=UPI002875A081|nr:dienelactone hydrolase family protein [Halomicroarcula sp. S1AR25-4]MDS0278351.1 dienelactone hydrolase family protein [Halomicroarcula sp. S1AR25-4]